MGNTPQRPGMLAVDLLNVIRKVQHMVMRPLFTLLFYVFALLFLLVSSLPLFYRMFSKW